MVAALDTFHCFKHSVSLELILCNNFLSSWQLTDGPKKRKIESGCTLPLSDSSARCRQMVSPRLEETANVLPLLNGKIRFMEKPIPF